MFIRELKIEETEDGYRIEIKGDKERLKQMFENGPFGMGMPFGFGMPHGPRPGGRGRWRWRWGGHHWKGGQGPWDWHQGPRHEEDDEPSSYNV